jgi:hypothetical protein
MRIVRYEDWVSRLQEAFRCRMREHFSYGRHDCCQAARYLLEAMTGQDFAADFPSYNQRKKALRIVVRAGGFIKLLDGIAAKYALVECLPTEARRGDPVVVGTRLGLALGIVDLTGTHVIVPNGRGWALVPLSQAVKAWRLD